MYQLLCWNGNIEKRYKGRYTQEKWIQGMDEAVNHIEEDILEEPDLTQDGDKIKEKKAK